MGDQFYGGPAEEPRKPSLEDAAWKVSLPTLIEGTKNYVQKLKDAKIRDGETSGYMITPARLIMEIAEMRAETEEPNLIPNIRAIQSDLSML